ncbi:MAG: ABC transporter permease [Campylobacteraceae bacterium]|nr:ABC transporter permease [Campylobacteraceae bacterium]
MDQFLQIFNTILLPAIGETLYMSILSTVLAFLLGFFPGIVLVLTDKNGLNPHPKLYASLDFVINTLRSFPFIILIIVLFPVTKLIVGQSIGTTAAIVPLTIGTAPFFAKLIESSFKEIDKAVIEAPRSYGATSMQIIFRIMLPEGLPSLISGFTLILIIVVGFSAMAGTIGGGGLGDVAIRYGYHRFRVDVMIYTVIILIIMVHLFQLLGTLLYRWSKH